MEKKTDQSNENLLGNVYSEESTRDTYDRVTGSYDVKPDDTREPPSSSAVDRAREKQDAVVPEQNGRNSRLSDGDDDAERQEYRAVHNDTSAPDYRDEIYKEKPVEGKIANQ